jgi:hypothetical protein
VTHPTGLISQYIQYYPSTQWNLWFYVAIIVGYSLTVDPARSNHCQYTASAVLNDECDPERRMYCLHYADCALRMRDTMKSVGEIGESILAMGYDKGVLGSDELVRYRKMEPANEAERKSPGYDFIVNRNSDTTVDPADARIGSLAEKFKDIVVFQELTEKLV